jgi:hypothetical protein
MRGPVGPARVHEAVERLEGSSAARGVKLGERPLMVTDGGAGRRCIGVPVRGEEGSFYRRAGRLPSWLRLEERGVSDRG